jgi:hypothetical protein
MGLRIIKAETVTGQGGQATDVFLEGNYAIRIYEGVAYLFEAAPGEDLDSLKAFQSVDVLEG